MARQLSGPDGQLQEIVVVKNGDRYEVRAGICRTLAARSLKWEKIRSLVKEGVSDFDKKRITFSENETRKNAHPLYQAHLLQGMLDTGEAKTQEDLADKIGKKRGSVSQYMMIGRLPAKIQEIAKPLANLGMGHLLQLCRLETPEDQIKMAEETAKNGLSIEKLMSLVDKMLKKKASPPAPLPKGEGGQRPGEASFIFKNTGPQVVVSAKWDRTADLDAWLSQLRSALMDWATKHPLEPDRREVSVNVTSSAPVVTTQTPEELLAEAQKTMPPELVAHLAERYAQIAARPSTSGSAAPVPNEQDPGETARKEVE